MNQSPTAPKWGKLETYTLYRNDEGFETTMQFHTRVANEIQIMDCKIVDAKFADDYATIYYRNRVDS